MFDKPEREGKKRCAQPEHKYWDCSQYDKREHKDKQERSKNRRDRGQHFSRGHLELPKHGSHALVTRDRNQVRDIRAVLLAKQNMIETAE